MTAGGENATYFPEGGGVQVSRGVPIEVGP